MTYSLRVHPEAAGELLDAIRYYEERAGAGVDFATAARAARRDVQRSPEAWPPVPYWTGSPEIRSRSVGQFPYRAVYYLRGREVVLIAYAHEKRRPGYWRHRTSE